MQNTPEFYVCHCWLHSVPNKQMFCINILVKITCYPEYILFCFKINYLLLLLLLLYYYYHYYYYYCLFKALQVWIILNHIPVEYSCLNHAIQYIPRNMHTVFALLCFVVVIHWLIFPYPSGLLHWHCGNLTIAPVPAKQPWWIWIKTSSQFIMTDCITTTKQSTTKPCAYFLGYTVCARQIISSNICSFYKTLICPTYPSITWLVLLWWAPKPNLYKPLVNYYCLDNQENIYI